MAVEKILDRIHIRDLEVRCIIGVYDHERTDRQELRANITLHADLADACKSDNIEDTIDYKALKKRILEAAENSSYFLVERLAEHIAEICMEDARVMRADVTIDKPGALRWAKSVAVEISRERPPKRGNIGLRHG